MLFNDFRIGLPGAVEKMKCRKIIIGLVFSSNTENSKNKQSVGQELHIKKVPIVLSTTSVYAGTSQALYTWSAYHVFTLSFM